MREELRLWVEEVGNSVCVQPSAKCHNVKFEHLRHVLQEFLRLGPEMGLFRAYWLFCEVDFKATR